MLFFAAVLVFATASTGLAQQSAVAVPARPPEQAAGQALISCVAHAMGMAPIAAVNAEALAGNGLVYTTSHPAFLEGQAQNEFGTATFAQVPSADGQVWAAGYDTGVCIVTAIGTPDGPVVERFEQLFAIPNTWKREKIKQLPGAKWSQYGWKSPDANLVAQMSVRELPVGSPAKGFVSITVSPKGKR